MQGVENEKLCGSDLTLSFDNVDKYGGDSESSYVNYFDFEREMNNDQQIGTIQLLEGDGNNEFPNGATSWVEFFGTLVFNNGFESISFDAGIMIGNCEVYSTPVD